MAKKKIDNTKLNKEEFELYSYLFEINNTISLKRDEIEVLKDLYDEVLELLGEYGETGKMQIREIVLDTLTENNLTNIIKYLGLTLTENLKGEIDDLIKDENFKKIEEKENKEDFFYKMINDETINDLIMTIRGYERKSDGNKEIFIKKSKARIPNKYINDINNILTAKFNKTNFLSNKEDEEQARLILSTYKGIFDIIMNIPYSCCNTTTTRGILNMVSVKLSNLIGFSNGFRKDYFEVVGESLKSEHKKKDSDTTTILE